MKWIKRWKQNPNVPRHVIEEIKVRPELHISKFLGTQKNLDDFIF